MQLQVSYKQDVPIQYTEMPCISYGIPYFLGAGDPNHQQNALFLLSMKRSASPTIKLTKARPDPAKKMRHVCSTGLKHKDTWQPAFTCVSTAPSHCMFFVCFALHTKQQELAQPRKVENRIYFHLSCSTTTLNISNYLLKPMNIFGSKYISTIMCYTVVTPVDKWNTANDIPMPLFQ